MYKLAEEGFASIFEYTLINFGGQKAEIYTSDMENVLNSLANSEIIGRDCPKIGDSIYRR